MLKLPERKVKWWVRGHAAIFVCPKSKAVHVGTVPSVTHEQHSLEKNRGATLDARWGDVKWATTPESYVKLAHCHMRRCSCFCLSKPVHVGTVPPIAHEQHSPSEEKSWGNAT